MKNQRFSDKSRNVLDSTRILSPSFLYERRFQRFKLQCRVQVKFRAGNELNQVTATTRNVSVGGFLLIAASAIPLDTPVTFVMTIRASSLVRPVHLTGTGQIVRLQPDKSGASFSIAVECISPIVQMEQYLPAFALC
jgi:PilZ domain